MLLKGYMLTYLNVVKETLCLIASDPTSSMQR